MAASSATPKQTAEELIEHLPGQASWNDIMHELYVMQKIVAEGHTIPHEEVKRRLMDKTTRMRIT